MAKKSSAQANKKIVVIGGGTGVFTVLSGLREFPLDLTAVVSMADDGGSTGILREEFGILPPGDVRRALIAMAPSDDRLLSDLFNYRFAEGGLRGHSFGNIMLTALERLTGSFEAAVDEASRILGVRGTVYPVTLENVRLNARLENGSVVRRETNINIPQHDGRMRIRKVWLEPRARLNPRAAAAIRTADMVIIGPGDLYTSIIPNLVVDGMARALQGSRAQKVYVLNLMTKLGETVGFSAREFIGEVERYAGKGVLDYVIANTKRPSAQRLREYEAESAEFVAAENLPARPLPILGDLVRRRGFVRHDPDRLAAVIVSLL